MTFSTAEPWFSQLMSAIVSCIKIIGAYVQNLSKLMQAWTRGRSGLTMLFVKWDRHVCNALMVQNTGLKLETRGAQLYGSFCTPRVGDNSSI
jgi:hypothetical protein